MSFLVQEHEQALVDAIARLGDLSDGESGKNFLKTYIFSLD